MARSLAQSGRGGEPLQGEVGFNTVEEVRPIGDQAGLATGGNDPGPAAELGLYPLDQPQRP